MSLAHPLLRTSSALETRSYTVTFTTPAFLGNATQQAQWRTPPFKALLREWWRVVRAGEMLEEGVNPKTLHQPLRDEEGRLFGNAWLKSPEGKLLTSRSRVRLRLDNWTESRPWDQGRGSRISIPGERNQFDSFIFAGFGPLTTRETRSALMPSVPVKWHISAPVDSWAALQKAIICIQAFGCLGSRSRNGWGSVALTPEPGTPALTLQRSTLTPLPSRDWKECLRLDWPHALGKDDQGCPLHWRSKTTFPDWRTAITEIAKLRKSINLSVANHRGEFSERHVLSMPVTDNSRVLGGDQVRLANQLRFKVVADGHRLLRVCAFHLPCGIPKRLELPELERIQLAVWTKVHKQLDDLDERMERVQ